MFEAVNGLLIGKPMDETYYEEYKKVLIETIDNLALPIVYNVNIVMHFQDVLFLLELRRQWR